MRVLVVVPTLGQRDLGPLAGAIARQCQEVSGPGDHGEGLLLHNGPHSEALAALGAASGVSYGSHPDLGYAAIRNEAVRRAVAGGFDVLVMIDDDELPVDGWLAALLAPFRADADVVVGPVRTAWPAGTPARFVRSALPRAAPDLPDGPIDADLRSGNCAIRLAALGDLRFDARFNVAGGEDTALFRQLRAQGARCHWAGAASVTELVDRDRIRLRYFARRSFAQGRTFAGIQGSLPRSGDVGPADLLRERGVRAARLAVWSVRDRNLGRLLEAACEGAFSAGYLVGRLARGRDRPPEDVGSPDRPAPR